jgi:uncharacterized membrane protein
LGLNRSHTPALAVGIGAVAGLRTLTAPAVLAWAAKRRWIRMGNSPFATIISAKASKRITDFAVSELIADKLPFTPKPGPFAARILSCAVCGAAIYSVLKRPLKEGAILGGLGAIAGAFAGYHMRRKLSGDTPHLSVALLEDAVAIGGGILVAALAAPD